MNREEFMKQLEQLLTDIPNDEREEALEFYTNYFEDAGAENEEQILRELGTPERVAQTIKNDLAANGEYSKDGEYTEHGYKDVNEKKESIIKVEPSVQEEKTAEGNTKNNQNGYGYQYNGQNPNGYQGGYNNGQNPNGYQGGYNNGQNPNGYQGGYYNGQQNYNNSQFTKPGYQETTRTNIPLLVLLCIFAFPVIIPITIAAFSTIFGLVIGFGAAGIACSGAGIFVVIVGIINVITFPARGLVAIGGGLICIGIGILFILLTIALVKVIPCICRAVVAVFKAPFGGRRVTA